MAEGEYRSSRGEGAKQEPVIIYRLGSLGDTVAALPCFHKINEVFPDRRRIGLTNFPVSNKAAPLQAILGESFIHDVIPYPVGMRNPKQVLRVIQKIRASKAKTLIYLGGGRKKADVYRDLFFFKLAGIRRVIGAPLTKESSYGTFDSETGLAEPESSRLAHCLSELGPIDTSRTEAWNLRYTANELAGAGKALSAIAGRPFIGVHMGGECALNDWGADNWNNLMALLSKQLSNPIVFVGSQEDHARAELTAQHWPNRTINSCGSLTPREVGALLAKAHLFIGHDSGPMHLASVQNVPCVVAFSGHDAPGKWYPVSPAPITHKILRNGTDIKLIRPQDMADDVLTLWPRLVRSA